MDKRNMETATADDGGGGARRWGDPRIACVNHGFRRMLSQVGPLGLREVYATVEWSTVDGKPRGVGGYASIDATMALAFMSGVDVDVMCVGVRALQDAGFIVHFPGWDHENIRRNVDAIRFTAVADAVPPWRNESRYAMFVVERFLMLDYLNARWSHIYDR